MPASFLVPKLPEAGPLPRPVPSPPHTKHVPKPPGVTPFGQRPRITTGTTAALVAVGGVLAGVLVFMVVLKLMGSGGGGNRAGTDLFLLGQATPLAATVGESGPLLLPDPLGRGRDVYVNHLGGGDWRTFEVNPPGAPARCAVRWTPDRRLFVDGCSGREYPPDGAGLVSYPTDVDDEGRVVVDLRHPQAPTTSVVPVTATAAVVATTTAR